MASMFEQLMALPLFSGVSYEQLARIVGDTKFNFLKYRRGDAVLVAGEQCCDVVFVVSGSVRYAVKNSKDSFVVEQTIKAPSVIAPEFLFGRHTVVPCAVVALEATSILRISKADYIKILNTDNVFLFNYLNILSAKAQTPLAGLLKLTPGEPVERLALWIATSTQPGGLDLKFKCIGGLQLHEVLGASAEAVENALEPLRRDGLIRYNASELTISNRAEFLSRFIAP